MGEKAAYLVPETLKGKNVACLLSDRSREGRMPHTSFRRHSRPFGQAYAPSEASGILFTKKSNILILFSEFVLQDKDNN